MSAHADVFGDASVILRLAMQVFSRPYTESQRLWSRLPLVDFRKLQLDKRQESPQRKRYHPRFDEASASGRFESGFIF